MELFDMSSYVEPFKEMVAYEAIWSQIRTSTFKQFALFTKDQLPSQASWTVAHDTIEKARKRLQDVDPRSFLVLIRGTPSYPDKLLDLQDKLDILYARGNIDLLGMQAVSVVGARSASEKGLGDAERIAKGLVGDGYAVVSGLAEGIDTAAHTAAIEASGRTIAVIGTPLDEVYPKKNKELQDSIQRDHLLISQVPFLRYSEQSFRQNRFFFPERNKTMAALTEATIIVEASDRSGTLTQARACLQMRRKLIILESALKRDDLSWPRAYLERGAVAARTYSEIRKILKG